MYYKEKYICTKILYFDCWGGVPTSCHIMIEPLKTRAAPELGQVLSDAVFVH